MSLNESIDVFLLQYAPENWSKLQRLLHFLGPPLPANGYVRIGLRDCESHLEKVNVLWRVATRLRPNLAKDREELELMGGSSNLNSQEYAAMCESVVGALYSAIDGLRLFIFGAYQHVQGVQRNSNGKLFQKAKDMKYGPELPEEIRTALAKAADEWFFELREFRTELTHGSTGSCHLDNASNRILYVNDGLKKGTTAHFQEDIEGLLKGYQRKIVELVEEIAQFHLLKLVPVPTFQICGWYRSRWYGRTVMAGASTSWNDGQCLSHDWFEFLEGFMCPLAKRCAAYERKYPGGFAAFSAAQ